MLCKNPRGTQTSFISAANAWYQTKMCLCYNPDCISSIRRLGELADRNCVPPMPTKGTYEASPESIQPFWISWKPFAWPWCNLAANQRRLYCALVNSRSSVGLVSRQRDADDWACVLCARRIYKSRNFQRRFWLWEKSEFPGSQIRAVGMLTALGDVIFCQKKVCTTAVEWADALLWWSWSARSVTQYTSSFNGVSLSTY